MVANLFELKIFDKYFQDETFSYFEFISDILLSNRHVKRLVLTYLQGMTEYKITKFFLTNATYSKFF